MKGLKIISLCVITILLLSCSPKIGSIRKSRKNQPATKDQTKESKNSEAESKNAVLDSEQKKLEDSKIKKEIYISETGKTILTIGQKMVDDGEIIRGSCWDYINEVYKRAGYKRTTVFKSKKKGPYANIDSIQPGDWLYYINHSYYGVEHSGIFVKWKDKRNKIGITLSYGGENRNKPGRYRDYDLKSVYYIQRGK